MMEAAGTLQDRPTVLLVGGTGRTGGRVMEQLLARGVHVRAIVRSPGKVPAPVAVNAGLELVEADLVSMTDEDLRRQLHGCTAVVSCLGHVISLAGVFGRPRDLVESATRRLCRAIESLEPAEPVKFVLMSSVSVNRPGGVDTRRGGLERAAVSVLRALVPPADDNQKAADFLCAEVGPANPFVQWVTVRPDTLLDGDVAGYALHEGLVSSLFVPDSTKMASIAHFMCELVEDRALWDRWAGGLPVIVDA